MTAKAWKQPGGSGGESVSAIRKRIAKLAEPHIERAIKTIVDSLEADRDTVRLQAATTLLDLADTGGEGMDETPGTPRKLVLVDRGQLVAEASKRAAQDGNG